MPNRRKVLIGLGGSIAIAGCSGETEEEEPEDTESEPEEEPESESEPEEEEEPQNESELEPEPEEQQEGEETPEEEQEEAEQENEEETPERSEYAAELIESIKTDIQNALEEYRNSAGEVDLITESDLLSRFSGNNVRNALQETEDLIEEAKNQEYLSEEQEQKLIELSTEREALISMSRIQAILYDISSSIDDLVEYTNNGSYESAEESTRSISDIFEDSKPENKLTELRENIDESLLRSEISERINQIDAEISTFNQVENSASILADAIYEYGRADSTFTSPEETKEHADTAHSQFTTVQSMLSPIDPGGQSNNVYDLLWDFVLEYREKALEMSQ